ncbi:MAG: alpha/beta hydrolase [Tepidisphaeraceae bacterium]
MSDATASVITVRLWETRAPLATGDEPADIPEIAIHRPKQPDRSAIVVCPGGGYGALAAHEAGPIAAWLNTLGVTGVVLKYRLAPRYRHPAMLIDVSRAIRTVRARAKEWKLDEKRVGVLGFSAGGHLAATVSTQFDSDDREPDAINDLSSRPDVSVLLYPVITLSGVSAHVGSRKNLLGDNPAPEMLDALSADRNVTAHTPPAFLFHTVADAGVPVENAILYALALRKAGVPFELHCFEPGQHGVGLAEKDPVLSVWPRLCAAWLATRRFGERKI